MNVPDPAISAGDVGRFVYCPLNWKRSVEGARGEGGEEGARRHQEMSERVDALDYYQRSHHVTSQTSFLAALVAISASVLGVEFFVLRSSRASWFVLVLLSVMLLAGSLYLLVFALYYRRRARDILHATKIQPGEVAFTDSAQQQRVLESRLFPLRGRPDYVVKRDGHFIPVELKTGRTPPRPYESHVLQLAAYCQLVWEEFGARPPFGILAYPERHFEIAYSDELEDELLRTLLRIQLADRTGEAHRNHTNPRRCQGCSRRDGCPERLDRP